MVKDPLRAARAARLLPVASRIRVLQLGAALEPELRSLAEEEQRENARYHWKGEVPRDEVLRILARCRLSVLSSHMEGGANAVVEALAARVPLLCSRISGTLGLLGDEHPGYFEVGDTEVLAQLLWRAESDAGFLTRLQESTDRARPMVEPARERAAWGELISDLGLE